MAYNNKKFINNNYHPWQICGYILLMIYFKASVKDPQVSRKIDGWWRKSDLGLVGGLAAHF